MRSHHSLTLTQTKKERNRNSQNEAELIILQPYLTAARHLRISLKAQITSKSHASIPKNFGVASAGSIMGLPYRQGNG